MNKRFVGAEGERSAREYLVRKGARILKTIQRREKKTTVNSEMSFDL